MYDISTGEVESSIFNQIESIFPTEYYTQDPSANNTQSTITGGIKSIPGKKAEASEGYELTIGTVSKSFCKYVLNA
jgi:hypothetical protein